jgi:hypothetical protein
MLQVQVKPHLQWVGELIQVDAQLITGMCAQHILVGQLLGHCTSQRL